MAKDKDDLGAAQVKSARDEAREKGYEGTSPTEGQNERYSLKSGPKSPSAAEVQAQAAETRAKEARAAVTANG